MMSEPLVPESNVMVRVAGLSKSFGGVHALHDVSLAVRYGVVHGLVGPNGAGKSTLIRCLAGIHQPDEGSIEIDGQSVTIPTPQDATNLGMAFIHQEMSLVPGWDVLRNMALGVPHHTRLGLINWGPVRARAREVAERTGMRFPLTTLIDDLSTADKWLVMIGRALMHDARLIAMDEPTASLSVLESERLHTIVRDLVAGGAAVIFVSHRLDEVVDLCDDVTVFKDGEVVRETTAARVSRSDLVRAIVGRDIDISARPDPPAKLGPVVLEVRGVSDQRLVRDVDLTVRAGEVVGLGGLVGAGRTELARMVFGAEHPTSGQILIDGEPVRYREPADAVADGLGMVPEERRAQGVFLDRSIDFNINLASLDSLRLSPALPLLRLSEGRRRAEEVARKVTVKARDTDQEVGALSGGNQQKVAIARWLIGHRKLLILDEPSRGVDVGARAEVHTLIRKLAADGTAVLVISSDNEELVALCDRVAVMAEGRVTGELTGAEITLDAILALSFAHSHKEGSAA